MLILQQLNVIWLNIMFIERQLRVWLPQNLIHHPLSTHTHISNATESTRRQQCRDSGKKKMYSPQTNPHVLCFSVEKFKQSILFSIPALYTSLIAHENKCFTFWFTVI